MPDRAAGAQQVLWYIRVAHTIAWAVFASSIVAIPVVTFVGRMHAAFWLSLLVWGEVIILTANRFHCPLTGIAARYTYERSDNFDIFLPAWLAKYNQIIFGTLFAISELYALTREILIQHGYQTSHFIH